MQMSIQVLEPQRNLTICVKYAWCWGNAELCLLYVPKIAIFDSARMANRMCRNIRLKILIRNHIRCNSTLWSRRLPLEMGAIVVLFWRRAHTDSGQDLAWMNVSVWIFYYRFACVLLFYICAKFTVTSAYSGCQFSKRQCTKPHTAVHCVVCIKVEWLSRQTKKKEF